MNYSRTLWLMWLLSAPVCWCPSLVLGESEPASAARAPLAVEGLALLRAWTPPVYPPDELKARHAGMVTVRLIVDATGRVATARALEDSDEAFVAAALAAVKTWGFAPAIEGGKPAACCLDTLVAFSPAVGQQKPAQMPPADQKFSPAQRTAPEVRVSPDGDYPGVLVERRIPGRAKFACTVTADGRAVNARVTAASHVDFVLPALQGLERWEFKPGQQGDLPVAAPIEGLVTFDNLNARGEETLAANGVQAPDGSAPRVAPMLIAVVDPVWPLERLLQGESGSATVDFTVTNTGFVRDVKVREASAPEFGEALRAAMENWSFDRPVEDNHVVSVTLSKHEEFKAVPLEGADPGDPQVRLVQKLRRGEIAFAKGLDERLTPIYRVRPEYPASLTGAEATKGAAEIEFVIDREGRVRLPRIVSATRAEFGWAAATAVSQWVFKAPRRGGEPVEVRAKIPIDFAVPVE